MVVQYFISAERCKHYTLYNARNRICPDWYWLWRSKLECMLHAPWSMIYQFNRERKLLLSYDVVTVKIYWVFFQCRSANVIRMNCCTMKYRCAKSVWDDNVLPRYKSSLFDFDYFLKCDTRTASQNHIFQHNNKINWFLYQFYFAFLHLLAILCTLTWSFFRKRKSKYKLVWCPQHHVMNTALLFIKMCSTNSAKSPQILNVYVNQFPALTLALIFWLFEQLVFDVE